MTNPIQFFFNTLVINEERNVLANFAVKWGDWSLSPVRYLFNGEIVEIETENNIYLCSGWKDNQERSYRQLIKSIILLLPGAIAGAAFKAIGYLLSSEARKEFWQVRACLTLLNHPAELGAPDQRLSLDQIKTKLSVLDDKTTHLTIYAEPEPITGINVLPEINKFKALRTLILVGAQIEHQPTGSNRLDETLKAMGFRSSLFRVHPYTFVSQQPVDTVTDPFQKPLWMNRSTLKPVGEVYLVRNA